MSRVVEEVACCRIDLAGGTADLWPLYLYLGGLELVNMAIDVKAKARVEWTPSEEKKLSFELCSKDYGSKLRLKNLKALEDSLSLSTKANPLRWVCRLVYHYLKDTQKFGHWKIETESEAPPGSGLGGSSVLGVALSKALIRMIGKEELFSRPWDLQRVTRDLESIEIEFPAGDQDYVPAIFGGLNVLSLGPNHREVEQLSPHLAANISKRVALLYTGKPHHSGLNNWQVFVEFHKPKSKTKKCLKEIVNVSRELAKDLRANNLARLSDLVNQEWECRKKLSPAINARVLENAWRFGKTNGAVARKACGAGGGGCLLLVFRDEMAKNKAEAKELPDKNWKWLSVAPGL